MNSVANKISETRKYKGLTQEELADQAQVNLRTIQRIENNENVPRGKTLNLICNALQLDIEELVSYSAPKKKINIGKTIAIGFFLVVFNMILMGIVGFLTLDSNANLNSLFGGALISFLLPFFIVVFTKNMTDLERMLKFGSGYFFYFLLIMINHGFPIGFTTGLFPCLFISLSVLYFGSVLLKYRD